MSFRDANLRVVYMSPSERKNALETSLRDDALKIPGFTLHRI